MSSRCRSAGTLAAIAAIAALATACRQAARAETSAPPVLRVCADPNNLPFSNDREEGFENRIARLVAGALGARVEYVWWAQRRGFVRNTLRAHACDVIVGVLASFELALTTRPYYRSSYVFVVRKGEPMPDGFDDARLRTARIGVHLIGNDFANAPPAHALANRGIVSNVRGFTLYGNYREPDPPAALVRAVASRAVDVAIVWGPLAGYFARQSPVPLTIAPVQPEIDPPFLPFVFDIAMGVRREDPGLRDRLNEVLVRHRREIDAILAEYAVPRVDHWREEGTVP